jgi:DNA invertase Pin-like site-specific DNA recombinase
VDALYFRVSSERQTIENQFEDLFQVAERDDPTRDWNRIKELISRCVTKDEHRSAPDGRARAVYRVDAQLAAELARQCVYIEQGRSGKIGAGPRPLFELMKCDAAARKFNRVLVWKVSRLGRDMREVICAVYELADLGTTVIPVKSATGPITSTMGKLLWAI